MVIHQLAKRYGAFQPEEVELLASIYDDIVASKKVSRLAETDIAGRILFLYRSGVKERERLHAAGMNLV